MSSPARFPHRLHRAVASALAAAGASLLLATPGPVPAQVPPGLPDAAASDPRALGLMQGFPPAPEKTIRFGDGSGYRFPQLRWAFAHQRELVPTAAVWRGAGGPVALPRAERDLDGVSWASADGKKGSWADMLGLTYADGILVLHRGVVVHERYLGALDARTPHLAMSLTKSFVGLLAASLAAEGKLDPAAPVTRYLPELKETAYGDATVRQVMDMTIGVQYSEVYTDPKAEIWDYARAGGMLPAGPDYKGPRTFYAFLATLKKQGEHGQAFAYKTCNAEVLAWILKRVSGKSLAALTSEVIWQKLGAEEDAFFTVDSVGTESGGGGLNTTLRDLARFGEMMRLGGKFNGQQVVPAAAVAEIRAGGDKGHFAKSPFPYPTLPGFSYRDMWWVSHDAHGTFEARGIHGQRIWIDPVAEVTIVRYASIPVAGNAWNDPITHAAFRAVAEKLSRP